MSRVAAHRIQWRGLLAAVLIVLIDSGEIAPRRTHAARLLRADFNGDGRDDLVIGAPFENTELIGGSIKISIPNTGAVHVLYGGPSGAKIDGTPPPETFTQFTAGLGEGAEAHDLFGSSIAIGNFNGDPYDDLAIGVSAEDLGAPSIVNAGGVHVLYGSPFGLSGTNSEFWHRFVPGLTNHVGGPAHEGDHFGWALAALDANNDGYDELAVSAPYADFSEPDQGVVFVLIGSTNGLTASLAQSLTPTFKPDARAGLTLAAGDFDGDACDDLAVGLPRDRGAGLLGSNGISGAGWISLHLSHCRPPHEGFFDNKGQPWSQNFPGIEGTAEVGDNFGSALAAGDFNGDSVDDLAIGVPKEDLVALPVFSINRFNAGVVHIIYGGVGGLSAANDELWDQSMLGETPQSIDHFGRSLAAADFNGDGRDDLAIGAPFESFGSVASAGLVHVLYGGSGGLNGLFSQLWHQDTGPELATPQEANDAFGATLSGADFNGDGAYDLAIGVSGEDTNAGLVHVIYGAIGLLGPGGLSLTAGPGAQSWQQSSAFGETPETGDGFGAALPGSRQ